MYITKLSLLNFRNLEKINIELNRGINIFFGDNAQGKTNLLEAVYMCATGRSQRTHTDSQLVCFNENEAHIQTFVSKDKRMDKIDVHIRKDEKKGIAINGLPIKKLGELFGTLQVVIFSPEDLQLIKNGPSERRRFLDMEICQISNVYYYNLQQYYRVLKQRNNLLKNIQKNTELKNTMFVWDSQLVEFGTKIMEKRSVFVQSINEIASDIHERITGGKEKLRIEYKINCDSKIFLKKLEHSLERDIFSGSTSIGPHKDDLLFYINENEVRTYGSQGQQRTAALSAKLAEISLFERESGFKPVLLLDDVLSELDLSRQLFLLENIENIQTIITCTGIEDSIKKYVDQSFLFNVTKGKISKSS